MKAKPPVGPTPEEGRKDNCRGTTHDEKLSLIRSASLAIRTSLCLSPVSLCKERRKLI